MNRRSINVNTLILGGGPAGICLSHLLQDDDTMLLEIGNRLGGLCGTINWKGCLFDIGGHVLTTKHQSVLSFLKSKVSLYFQTRKAFVAYRGEIVRYPFQKYFRDLSNQGLIEQIDCNRGQGAFPNSKNFDEYLIHTLGNGIYDAFARPYNEKLWGDPLSRLSPEWGDERIAPKVGSLRSVEVLDRQPLTSETIVGYPEKGGFSTIFDELAKAIGDVAFGCNVRHIDILRKRVETSEGDVVTFNRLISTIPLDSFLGITSGISDKAREVESELEAIGLRLVLLKHKGRLSAEMHRLYVPDQESPAHKVVFQNTSSPFLYGETDHGIMAEVSQASQAHLSDKMLIDLTVRGLENVGILKSKSSIIEAKVLTVPKAYPVQTLEKKRKLDRLRRELGEHDVNLLGRFAEWDYINADQVILRALNLAAGLRRDSTPTSGHAIGE